ncbi:hypothetical protein [Dyella acidisoli]|uniref:Uncharacterized protein n=1 Tax=Dyella acidisoli TaxID=1867834 RepID=A0ABQ5XSI3_9GAMM|nr:hypothetical protein [Dyella acidisoli]GLQ93420.1 hypothetical protein GCM10007901_23710 [Dyella acidisoli]
MANKSMPPTLLEAGWYLSYMNYAATGEGLRSCLAVAGTAEAAERILKEKLPEYFHRGIVTTPIDADAGEDVKAMIQWIPLAASEILRQIPPGAGHYFTEIHYNLS